MFKSEAQSCYPHQKSSMCQGMNLHMELLHFSNLECYHLSRVDKHPKSDKIEIREKVIENEEIQ